MKTRKAMILTIMACVLSGCATTVGSPKTSDEEAIKKGEKTIVLVRVNTTVGGQPLDALTKLNLYAASMNRGEPIQHGFLASPSPDARQAGWVYFLLRPGETYYLQPRLLWHTRLTPMWFHIPPNTPLVYGGSLSTSCGKGDSAAHSLPCTALSIKDETEEAQKIASHSLSATYGELATSLMRPWPIVPGPRPLPAISPDSPLSLVVSCTKTALTPSWYERAFGRTVVVVNPGGGGGPIGMAIVAANLAYLPVGVALGAAGGAHSKSKWQPCMDKLSEELRSYDYEKELETAVTNALQKPGAENTGNAQGEIEGRKSGGKDTQKLILETNMHRVKLSECKETWTFFVDTSIRASLRQADNGHYLYDLTFGNSDKESHNDSYPYQFQTSAASPCRKIEEYCDPDKGPIIFREEITSALNAAAQEIAKDLIQQPRVTHADTAEQPITTKP